MNASTAAGPPADRRPAFPARPATRIAGHPGRAAGKLELTKDADLQHWLKTIRAQYPTVEKFERDFPTLCFALATGVGKTRLMGAIIAWLFITGRSRHFFVLAPNLTIYEKLKHDFRWATPSTCLPAFPNWRRSAGLVTGEDYEDGRGVRLDIAVPRT
jgi:type III restriction enzyme